jgi:hypothetical protein
LGPIFSGEFLHLFHEIAAVDRVRSTPEENFLLMHASSVVNFLPSDGNATTVLRRRSVLSYLILLSFKWKDHKYEANRG